MKKTAVLFCLFPFAFCLGSATACAQTPQVATIGSGGGPALIRFQVAPQKGKPVTDLGPGDIEIYEDGQKREVVLFEGGSLHPRTVPTVLSLLIDCGRSDLASGKVDAAVFKKGLLDEFPHLSVAVYGFASGPARLAARTRNEADLTKALSAPLLVHPLSTFLMDHVSRVLIDAAAGAGPAIRIVSVFSTGRTDQGASSATAEEQRYQRALSIAQQTGVAVYPVLLIPRLAAQDSTPGAAPLEARSSTRGPQPMLGADISTDTRLRTVGNFVNLGASTGGKKIEIPAGGNMLPTAVNWLAEQLRNEYIAGFQPTTGEEKRRHNLEVVMKNKDRAKITGGTLTLVY